MLSKIQIWIWNSAEIYVWFSTCLFKMMRCFPKMVQTSLNNDQILERHKAKLEGLEKTLENTVLVAKIGIDAAENEPRKVPKRWTMQRSPFLIAIQNARWAHSWAAIRQPAGGAASLADPFRAHSKRLVIPQRHHVMVLKFCVSFYSRAVHCLVAWFNGEFRIDRVQ